MFDYAWGRFEEESSKVFCVLANECDDAVMNETRFNLIKDLFEMLYQPL